MTEYAKPLPFPDHDTKAFWDACKEHELKAQRCTKCGRFRWPPQEFCPSCYSWEYQWTALPGRGAVTSFSVVHHSVAPGFREEIPYVVAVITLDGTDGHVSIASNIVDCPWEKVQVGMPVEVLFEDASPEVALPKFRLV